MTQPRKWPNAAEWARQDCIAMAAQARIRILKLIDTMNDPAAVRQLVRVVEDLHTIEDKLRKAREQND